MAGGQERVLRRRIKSVNATKKITKAMELIAASQISKAQSRIAANRPYRAGMAAMIVEAAAGNRSIAEKLLGTPERVTSMSIVCVAGDRGLSGAYNSSVLRATERLIDEQHRLGVQVRLYTVGKKAPAYFRFRGYEVLEAFQGFSDKPEFADARAVAKAIAAPFTEGTVQQVILVSTHYKSAASQEVSIKQILPLEKPEQPAAAAQKTGPAGYTDFEPDVEHLLNQLAPKAVEAEIFAALLEGAASFHASQQRAMAAATENAEELARNLSRIMNRARQDAITTEIMEIVGGAEALRPAKGA